MVQMQIIQCCQTLTKQLFFFKQGNSCRVLPEYFFSIETVSSLNADPDGYYRSDLHVIVQLWEISISKQIFRGGGGLKSQSS